MSEATLFSSSFKTRSILLFAVGLAVGTVHAAAVGVRRVGRRREVGAPPPHHRPQHLGIGVQSDPLQGGCLDLLDVRQASAVGREGRVPA